MCLGFALVVVVLVLAWGLVVNFTALDKVVVGGAIRRVPENARRG